jgi:predicted HTH transcriptional regulator
MSAAMSWAEPHIVQHPYDPMNTTARHASQVLSLIKDREREHIEFKRRVPSLFKMAKEIAAMANTVGGNILIGVDDDGTISGVEDAQKEKDAIFRASRELCSPPLDPQIKTVVIHGKTVLWIIIAPGTVKRSVSDPCGNTRVYVRVRDKNLLASKQTARQLSEGPSIKLPQKHLDRQELALLDYLWTHEKITLAEFCRSANISKRRASRICIKLEKAGLIRSHDFDKKVFYTLNPGMV